MDHRLLPILAAAAGALAARLVARHRTAAAEPVPDVVFDEIVRLQPSVIEGLRRGNSAIAEHPDAPWRLLYELAAQAAIESREVEEDPLGSLAALRQAAAILSRAEEEMLAA